MPLSNLKTANIFYSHQAVPPSLLPGIAVNQQANLLSISTHREWPANRISSLYSAANLCVTFSRLLLARRTHANHSRFLSFAKLIVALSFCIVLRVSSAFVFSSAFLLNVSSYFVASFRNVISV